MVQKNISAFCKIKRYACYTGLIVFSLFSFLFYSPHATIFSPRSSILFALIYGALLGVATFFILIFVYGFLTKQIIRVKRPPVNFDSEAHIASAIDLHDSPRLEWHNDVSNPANPAFQARERAISHDY